METLVPSPEATEFRAPDSVQEPTVDTVAESPDATTDLAPPGMPSSRFRRAAQKAKRVAVGEGVGTAVEAGMMAVGVPLPLREVVGTGIDMKTYGADGQEAAQTPEQKRQARIKKYSRAAGFLALNLVAGYAMQKGVPILLDSVGLDNDTVDGGVQLAGKVGTMTGASSVINRKIGL